MVHKCVHVRIVDMRTHVCSVDKRGHCGHGVLWGDKQLDNGWFIVNDYVRMIMVYHVNPATGESGKCGAKSPESCPFGAENHYRDKTAADAAGEAIVSSELFNGSMSMGKSGSNGYAARDGFAFHADKKYSDVQAARSDAMYCLNTVGRFYDSGLDEELRTVSERLEVNALRMSDLLGDSDTDGQDEVSDMSGTDREKHHALKAYDDRLMRSKMLVENLMRYRDRNVGKLRDNRLLVQMLGNHMDRTRATELDHDSQHRYIDRLNGELRRNGHGNIQFHGGGNGNRAPRTEIIATNGDTYILRNHSNPSYTTSTDQREREAGDTVSIQAVDTRTGTITVSRPYGRITGENADGFTMIHQPSAHTGTDGNGYNDIPSIYQSIMSGISRETMAMKPEPLPTVSRI